MKKFEASNGIIVSFGHMPSGLVPDFDDVVYFFQTNLKDLDTQKYETAINECISRVVTDSFDHWKEFRPTKKGAPVWNQWHQVTLVNFYIKDSY